jgi:hypothetical protein
MNSHRVMRQTVSLVPILLLLVTCGGSRARATSVPPPLTIVSTSVPVTVTSSPTSPPVENQGADFRGQITDEDTGIPLPNVTIALGERITYTDSDGNFEFSDIASAGSYLLTATVSNYEDYGERVEVFEGDNWKSVSLRSTGTYTGDAEIEFEVSIVAPETGYAHVSAAYEVWFGSEIDTLTLDMHYVYDTGISIENIAVTNENGVSLPWELNVIYDGFYWYLLDIELGDSETIYLEYDIHYVSICHDGDPTCIHAYICDSYGVFENMAHILFTSGRENTPTDSLVALRFVLPSGWIRVTPWVRIGDHFVDIHNDILGGSAGVGRFELFREPLRNTEVEIGIHENASDFSSWSVNFQSVWPLVEAGDNWLLYDRPFATAIGIPPLGPNETAVRFNYSPATTFPFGYNYGLTSVNDIDWTEGRWIGQGIGYYLGELILYQSGAWSRVDYMGNMDYRKDLYLNETYGSACDLSIPDLWNQSDPACEEAKQAKFYLFTYLLDYEIRRATVGNKRLSDVIVCWRHRFVPIHHQPSHAELLEELNACIGSDFTDFFDRYYYGTEKLPIEMDWDPWKSQQLFMPIVMRM